MTRADTLACAAAAVVLLLVGLVYPRLPGQLVSLPDREWNLPGGAAVLFPSAAAATAGCGTEPVVFADAKAHVFYRAGEPLFAAWGGRAFPDRGFGCADDVRANGFAPA